MIYNDRGIVSEIISKGIYRMTSGIVGARMVSERPNH